MQGQQPSNLNMTYEQFQEQVRLRELQEQEQARIALQRAGADSGSGLIRQLIQELQNIQQEVQLSANQLQVQMDAQKRQTERLVQRIQQAEQLVRSSLGAPGAAGNTVQQPPVQGYTQ
ncbi:hypothetical protein ABEV74_07375 [Paenibacillus cisolokensis]|uniref:Uncharacterized protein n=1 Tax=Paenibacillus cisolokensis TaxID=1658519 RepID=A0ABQ4N8Z6_9BACL|nr:hypothetical protein [Paenibacillus cisolokensis]GIQ64671.1 hypothetical protein PACILC2_32390 [Paenibacillus cisolokensis]